MARVTVSIVTWNSASTIDACIESILNQGYRDFAIQVVDNGSEDQTLDLLSRWTDSRLRIEALGENTGYCGGHNYIIRNSSSEFVLAVNPDAILENDYIGYAVDRMESNSRIGIVCGLLLANNAKEPPIDTAGLDVVFRDRRFFSRGHLRSIVEADLSPREVAGADGALPLYRRRMIDDVSDGGEFFDSLFFAHKEDWDVSWRAQLYGWIIFFEPKCRAVHPRRFRPDDRRSRRKVGPQLRYHAVKNQLILIAKNEDLENFAKDWIYIVGRQLAVLGYCAVREWSSLRAYGFVFAHFRQILQRRKKVQSGRRVDSSEIRERLHIGG